MTELQVRNDISYLAGNLTHRSANSEPEQSAAKYILDRLKGYTPDAALDEFYSLDNPWLLFGSYYGEFFVVAILAIWWPRIALCYGAAVFIAYMAEFSGYNFLGRFLPQYETQNVSAQFLAKDPRHQYVIMAHYDSGKTSPLLPDWAPAYARWAHNAAMACMLGVILTCAISALPILPEYLANAGVILRWFCAACLVTAGLLAFLASTAAESTRGANNNASGVAVILGLAERLAQHPLQHADVCILATGSQGGWMQGIRHYLETNKPPRQFTSFINIDRVGTGQLAYTLSEGLMYPMPCSPRLTAAAQATASPHGLESRHLRRAYSDALIPLARGFEAISITAIPGAAAEQDEPSARHDTLVHVDYPQVARATDFTEALLRRLDEDLDIPHG